MSYITWRTAAGSIGSISQNSYVDIPLDAVDSNQSPLEFTRIAGTMPLGLEVSSSGKVKGIPVIDSTGLNQSITSTFTVRANTPAGVISDRSFSITINNFSPIKILLTSNVIGTFLDGNEIKYQFIALSDNPAPALTWTIVSGETPIDILTNAPMDISRTGLLKGYISRAFVDTAEQGYDATDEDMQPYDFIPAGNDRSYSFTVQVSDGSSFDAVPIRIDVISKSTLSADNINLTTDTVHITVDIDNLYVPIITTDTTNLPILAVADKFSFKFDAIDPSGDVVYWRANSALAATGLTISSVTGWVSGTILPHIEQTKDHQIGVTAYKRDNPVITSPMLSFTITTVKDSTNFITWKTPAALGSIINGTVSELAIAAVNAAGKSLTYSLEPGSRLPLGLSLIDNNGSADIIGKSNFKYFSIDGASANITVASTAGITTDMIVQGPGVASGSAVLAIYGPNTVRISPATYITAGVMLTFSDLIAQVNITTQLTDLSTTTSMDGGSTTFDNTYKFKVKATAVDNSVSTVKEFTLIMDNYNRAPYENIYISALLNRADRRQFTAIVNNVSVFPPEFLYRPRDPNFGIATTLRMLFLPGLSVSTLNAFSTSILQNHYNKTVLFGKVKTARAMNSDFTVKYEVVYIEAQDDKDGAPLSESLQVSHPHTATDGVTAYQTIYPNSYANMQYRVARGVGYANRGALPDWMTSRQEDGTELGLVQAMVLAYSIPGKSKLMAYRLHQSMQRGEISFSDIQFVADRYILESSYVANYNPDTNQFFSNPTDLTNKYIKYPQVGVYPS